MSDSPTTSHEPEKRSLGKKMWFGFLVIMFVLLSFLLVVLLLNYDEMHWPPIKGLVALVLVGSLFSAWFYLKLLFSLSPPIGRFRNIGAKAAGVSFFCALFLVVVLPSNSSYKKDMPDADTKSNLHNVYLACMAYWEDWGDDTGCDVDQIDRNYYGYIQSAEVSVSGSGTKSTFSAQGSHKRSAMVFVVNSKGKVTPLSEDTH